MYAFKPSWFMLTLVFCLVAINGGFFIWAWASDFSVSNENGPTENL